MHVPCPPDSETWLNSPNTVLIFSHFMAVIVTPLHLIGTFCILNKTPSSMHSVKWTLLNLHFWNVAIDMMLNVFSIPFPLFPTASGFLLGVFGMIGIEQLVQLWIMITSLSLLCVSTTMIFENRFYLLNTKNIQWKRFRTYWMFGNIIFCFIYPLPIILQIPDQNMAREIVLNTLPCIPDFLISTVIIVPSLDPFVIVITCIFFILVVFGELITFALIIIVQLSSNFGANMSSENTRRLQKKLIKALIWQTGIPIMYLVLPATCSIFIISAGIYRRTLNNLIVAVTSLHGLLSTSSMIFFHQPYRNAVTSWFPWNYAENSRTVANIPMFSTNTALKIYTTN